MKNIFAKYMTSFGIILILSLVLVACSSDTSSESSSSKKEIVTSFYPIEFVVQEIGGDDFNVSNITPLGAEPHDIELTPQMTDTLLEADLAIVLGEGFQPAIEKTAESRDKATLNIFEALEGKASSVSYLVHGDEDHSDEGDEGHSHGEGEHDPHIWLDPIEMKAVVSQVSNTLSDLNPGEKETYERNAKELVNKLDELDASYSDSLQNCKTDTFITSHDAFSRMADRYDLVQESIAGISPDAEPTADRIVELKEIAKDKNIEVVFTEELVSKKVAETLSNEAGLKTDVLSPIEGLTKEQKENGEDYLSIMESNLKKLVSALGCEPQS